MNYKKIIKSRKLRLQILSLLSFIPDKPMIMLQYWLKTGRHLHLKEPKRFTEKLQWYKLYYKNPDMIRCVDKFDVRSYVAEKGFESILIPSYGVYDSADDIDWSSLPNQFVMKDTLGGGGNAVIIVKNQEDKDYERLRVIADAWTKINAHVRGQGREWPYYCGKRHRILFEKLINDYNEKDAFGRELIDYKFFCFDGKAKYVYVITGRTLGNGAEVGIYDIDFNILPYTRNDERTPTCQIAKPTNYSIMVEIAEKLSFGFPEVRVDLYNVEGTIYFGEMTFYDGSGYMTFNPDDFDYELGSHFDLPSKRF